MCCPNCVYFHYLIVFFLSLRVPFTVTAFLVCVLYVYYMNNGNKFDSRSHSEFMDKKKEWPWTHWLLEKVMQVFRLWRETMDLSPNQSLDFTQEDWTLGLNWVETTDVILKHGRKVKLQQWIHVLNSNSASFHIIMTHWSFLPSFNNPQLTSRNTQGLKADLGLFIH